jgi:hypothetical protein
MLSWLPGIIGERSLYCQSLIMREYDIFTRNKRPLIQLAAANIGIFGKEVYASVMIDCERIVFI